MSISCIIKPRGSFMRSTHALEFDLTYLKQLIGAGLDGIESARREHARGAVAPRPAVWTRPAIGPPLGVLTTRVGGKRNSASRTAWVGFVGGVLGISAGLAWA